MGLANALSVLLNAKVSRRNIFLWGAIGLLARCEKGRNLRLSKATIARNRIQKGTQYIKIDDYDKKHQGVTLLHMGVADKRIPLTKEQTSKAVDALLDVVSGKYPLKSSNAFKIAAPGPGYNSLEGANFDIQEIAAHALFNVVKDESVSDNIKGRIVEPLIDAISKTVRYLKGKNENLDECNVIRPGAMFLDRLQRLATELLQSNIPQRLRDKILTENKGEWNLDLKVKCIDQIRVSNSAYWPK